MKLPQRSAAGFTLTELMVVVAIIAIVAVMAIGGTMDWRRRMEHIEIVREVFNTLNSARAGALEDGKRVTARLETGSLIAFADDNGNGSWDDGEKKYHEFYGDQASRFVTGTATEVWTGGITIDAAQATARNDAPVVLFDNMGTCVDKLGEPFAGTIIITDTDPEGSQQKVEVTMAGALRVTK